MRLITCVLFSFWPSKFSSFQIVLKIVSHNFLQYTLIVCRQYGYWKLYTGIIVFHVPEPVLVYERQFVSLKVYFYQVIDAKFSGLQESIQILISHLVERYSSKLESIDYVDTFRALKLKYEQVCSFLYFLTLCLVMLSVVLAFCQLYV